MINIAVIGSGQLGSRHLQSLSNLDNTSFKLFVVDSNLDSLTVAKQRFDEVAKTKFDISYYNSINDLPYELEVVIIATSSLVRKMLTELLLQTKKVKYLVLEKFLFPVLTDYSSIQKLLNETNTKTFVNCPRRMWEMYYFLKHEITTPIHFNVTGNGWGIGSNGVHMLDLFSYLNNDEEIIEIENQLDKEIIESKRSGYIEFTGTLRGSTKNGSRFEINSYKENLSPILISIFTSTQRFILKEEGAKVTLQHSTINTNWKWEEKIVDLKFQSQLSHLFVNDLIKTKTCQLTDFTISSKIHKTILEVFLNHINLNSDIIKTVCPIT